MSADDRPRLCRRRASSSSSDRRLCAVVGNAVFNHMVAGPFLGIEAAD